MLKKLLESMYSDTGPERIGLILKGGALHEVFNDSIYKFEGFYINTKVLIELEDKMVASWHTHPNESAAYSVTDHQGFINWPHIDHYVIGNDGLRGYYVKKGKILEYEKEDILSRLSEEAVS